MILVTADVAHQVDDRQKSRNDTDSQVGEGEGKDGDDRKQDPESRHEVLGVPEDAIVDRVAWALKD